MDSDKQIKPWTKWSPWYVRRKIMEGSSCSRIFLCDSSPRWRQGSFATQLKAQLCSCIPAHFYFPCRLQFPQVHALTWTRHMRNVWYINSQAAESLAKWGSTWGSAAARKPQRGRWKKPGPPTTTTQQALQPRGYFPVLSCGPYSRGKAPSLSLRSKWAVKMPRCKIMWREREARTFWSQAIAPEACLGKRGIAQKISIYWEITVVWR